MQEVAREIEVIQEQSLKLQQKEAKTLFCIIFSNQNEVSMNDDKGVRWGRDEQKAVATAVRNK